MMVLKVVRMWKLALRTQIRGECKSGGHKNEGQQNDSNIHDQTVPLVITSPVVKQPASFHLNAKAFKKGPSAPSLNVSYIS